MRIMDMLLGFLFILVIVAILGSVTGISIYFEKKKKNAKSGNLMRCLCMSGNGHNGNVSRKRG